MIRKDLRFGHAGEAALADWIAKHTQAKAVPASFPSLLDRLLNADKLTAEAEARELILHAARDRMLGSGGEEVMLRRAAMLMCRHLSPTGAGRILSEVGIEFGVTKQRVRQVCDAIEVLLATSDAVTPGLDRVLQAAARISPAGVDEINRQLRRLIGENAGIESLVSWAAVLGRASATSGFALGCGAAMSM